MNERKLHKVFLNIFRNKYKIVLDSDPNHKIALHQSGSKSKF